MAVIAINDIRGLKKYVGGVRGECPYIRVEDLGAEAGRVLRENSCREIPLASHSEAFREEFFKAYIDLIGHIGSEANSTYWWAGFTASKNRFISKLLPKLLLYYSICKVLEERQNETTLVLTPNAQITNALRRYCVERSIEFRELGSPLIRLKARARSAIEHVSRLCFSVLNAWVRTFRARRLFKGRIGKVSSDAEYYTLRTWVYSSSISKEGIFNDPFFGKLPEHLVAREEKLIIIAGIIGSYKEVAGKMARCRNRIVFPQELFLGYSDPVRAALRGYFNKIRLRRRVDLYGLNVTDIIQGEIDRDFRRYVRTELLQEYIVKNLTRRVRIQTFTTTHENNPWERVCFLSLRANSPDTKIIGYQHAVVTRASANMFPSANEDAVVPKPDRIATVGEVTKEIMEEYGHYPDNMIQASCALRHEYIYKLKRKKPNRYRNILVALEGVPECCKLVNFAYRALSGSKAHTVVIRPHPERPIEKIEGDLHFDIDRQDNFTVSEIKSLSDELISADILIYWGSTVSLEALMSGIPAIHVNLEDTITVDPLFNCNSLKWTVKDEDGLRRAISDICKLSPDDYERNYESASAYIEKFLVKPTRERMEVFII